ncbi:hypothetical protein AAMO2058_000684700, partial [Amorphochlora amoebiformis]
MCAHYKGTNADGNRAAKLAREREAQKKEFDRLKKSIEDENKGGLKAMDKSFTTHSTAVEDRFKASTVGLVTAEDFKKKRRLAEMAIANEKRIRERAMAKIRKKRKKERKRALSSLSFATEGEEGEDEEEEAPVRPVGPKKKKKTKKCPFVDTSFLPDKDREDEEIRLREELKREWKTNQERMK